MLNKCFSLAFLYLDKISHTIKWKRKDEIKNIHQSYKYNAIAAFIIIYRAHALVLPNTSTKTFLQPKDASKLLRKAPMIKFFSHCNFWGKTLSQFFFCGFMKIFLITHKIVLSGCSYDSISATFLILQQAHSLRSFS